MHYGVPGMKWGHRKAQPTSSVGRAKAAYKQAKKDFYKSYNSAYGYSNRHTIGRFVSKKIRAESERRWNDARDKSKALDSAKKVYKNEKKAYKNEKKAAKKAAVKGYSKTYNTASRMSDAADKKWSEVKEQHKALGKNFIERAINSQKNTAQAKAYRKNFDEASRMSDEADVKWTEAKEKYKKTGRNTVSRVANNIRYR